MFNGYLIKIIAPSGTQLSDYTIPLEYVLLESYKGTYSALDKDSTRNGNGRMMRTVLPHKVAHSSIDIRPLSDTGVASLMGNIQTRYAKEREKKVVASIWVPEINNYIEEEFYVPDIEFTINKIENGKVFYKQFTLEFIGY